MNSRADRDARTTELALAAGRGDHRALESFIRETQRDVWRFIAHLSSVAAADDLTQETYLRAMKSLPRFAAQSSARTWLLSIARRVVVDQVRSAMSRPRLVGSDDWIAAADTAHSESSTSTNHSEDLVEVRMLLAGLPTERREALILTQVLGLSYDEAAHVLGCPIGTVRSRVARAREQLVAAARADGENTG
ncbi:RNA polymerase subunit sigma [Rhodococcus sp. 05-2256-B2]|uniref:sigma-70 family RNA polymerase sigma factor n=1 Tax=Nocardiaceae TaxID=85025 RepID=UPI00050C4034|nr:MULTISPECIES: sigma-70 family RNA polymerase sigma factor [Rhodococcus]MBY4208161.1 sigma-70 family RNA polymerase sigma factor [Rhodococcus fascians]RZL76232.1 MAG: sigma-70 family RNA polymerase sigma factor [Rhodococcus sp. (in: high G+C Gram-positive bacteria)]OZD10401.1 RNA polymerase subunit sigma [Rhodococcus sp. 06-235-1A]OZD78892.1 RNA polymerase subunit sigma [Rhodococcus sp. 05-2256-B4]OZD93995.1 RNA polymerase subunit sigma [Rhodococcus sp. 05-2256-B3]